MRRSRCCRRRALRSRAGAWPEAPARAEAAAAALGVPVMVKAQVPAGKRGKAGGIRRAGDPEAARDAASAILGMEIAGHRVASVLVEEQMQVAAEYYAAVLSDAASKGPLVMFSPEGGVDVEEIAASMPDRLGQAAVDILRGFDLASARAMLGGLGVDGDEGPLADTLVRTLSRVSRQRRRAARDQSPRRLEDGRLVALDCKFVLDDSGIQRRQELAGTGSPETLTALEARGAGPWVAVHRARRRHRRARQRRRAHHDHHGRDRASRQAAGEFPGDRRRRIHQGQAGPGARARQPQGQVPPGELLRGLRAHRRDDRRGCSTPGRRSSQPFRCSSACAVRARPRRRRLLRERLGVTPCETMDEAIVAAVAAARDAGGSR